MQEDRRSANRLAIKVMVYNTANDALRQQGKVTTNSGSVNANVRKITQA